VTRFREAFPILHVDDVGEAVAFYRSTFGFAETFSHGDDGRPVFAFLALDPLGIGVALRPQGEPREFSLWIYADDVDTAAERLRAAGAEEVLPPTDQPWGERMCSFVAPDGHLVHVGAKVTAAGGAS
jgi:lactoylglutathione lyase